MKILIAVVLLLIPLAFAKTGYHPEQSKPKEFAVMAWGESPSDADELRGMKDAGLNISGFCRAEDLSRVEAVGLSCFVSDPELSGYAPDHLPPIATVREHIVALKQQVAGHPAALGFYLHDEPATLLMPGLGKIAAVIRDEMPSR